MRIRGFFRFYAIENFVDARVKKWTLVEKKLGLDENKTFSALLFQSFHEILVQ